MLREDPDAVAARLDEAERTRVQIRMVSLDNPGMDLLDAYAVQTAWIKRKLAAGRRRVGRKVGLTSRAMQAALGIDTPDHGVLLDDMLFEDGGAVPINRFIGLRIEVELAFVLNRRLDKPGCTVFDVLAATEFITPALEILDTRIRRVDPDTGRTRTVLDTISDNAANAGVVLGGEPFRPGRHDLRWAGAICSKNGAVEETGLAAGVLGHPARAVAWLAGALAAHGEALEPGEVVLSGSFIRPMEVGAGDTVHADFGRLGAVSCRFA